MPVYDAHAPNDANPCPCPSPLIEKSAGAAGSECPASKIGSVFTKLLSSPTRVDDTELTPGAEPANAPQTERKPMQNARRTLQISEMFQWKAQRRTYGNGSVGAISIPQDTPVVTNLDSPMLPQTFFWIEGGNGEPLWLDSISFAESLSAWTELATDQNAGTSFLMTTPKPYGLRRVLGV